MVTVEKIAEVAGVSPATVSHVLGRRSHLYRPETRRRIAQAAQRLGYRPSASARAMRSGRTGAVGLLLSTEPHRSSLFENELMGIYDGLAERDLRLTVARLPDEKLTSEGFVPKILREWSSDGLLINYNSMIPQAMVDLIEQYNIPSIWMNSKRPTDAVYPDEFAAGRQATEHLLSLGHRRIAWANYSGVEHFSASDRRTGYLVAMQQAGLSPQVIESETGSKIDRAERIALSKQWMEASDRPTAVVAYAKSTAVPILLAAEAKLGLRVGRDLSIVTYDNRLSDESGMALDTVIMPEYDLGRAAVEMLIQKIEAPGEPIPSRCLPLSLERGASSSKFIPPDVCPGGSLEPKCTF